MRVILINILVFLALVAVIGIGGYLFYNNYNFYSTDDAQVTSNIVNITTTTPGTLNSLSVKVGDRVSGGQTIGTINASDNKGGAISVNLTAPIGGGIRRLPAAGGRGVSPRAPRGRRTRL